MSPARRRPSRIKSALSINNKNSISAIYGWRSDSSVWAGTGAPSSVLTDLVALTGSFSQTGDWDSSTLSGEGCDNENAKEPSQALVLGVSRLEVARACRIGDFWVPHRMVSGGALPVFSDTLGLLGPGDLRCRSPLRRQCHSLGLWRSSEGAAVGLLDI